VDFDARSGLWISGDVNHPSSREAEGMAERQLDQLPLSCGGGTATRRVVGLRIWTKDRFEMSPSIKQLAGASERNKSDKSATDARRNKPEAAVANFCSFQKREKLQIDRHGVWLIGNTSKLNGYIGRHYLDERRKLRQ
jgi:hypothetical protein